MSAWGKIAIGTRLNDRCDPLFFNCWSHLISGGLRLGDIVLDAGIELPQHFAANVLAAHFLVSDAETLCMVDTDMIFNSDTLDKLRDDPIGQNYAILSALSVTRRAPYYPIVLRYKKDANGGAGAYVSANDSITGAVVPVDTVGTGFTLIRRAVFTAMAEHLDIAGKWFFDFGPCGLGEDTNFCQRAAGLGFGIAVHTGITIGHRGPISFVWNQEKQRTEMECFHQCRELLNTKK
jgi:hypothetical protein